MIIIIKSTVKYMEASSRNIYCPGKERVVVFCLFVFQQSRTNGLNYNLSPKSNRRTKEEKRNLRGRRNENERNSNS